MSSLDRLDKAIMRVSGGAVSLVPVPDELRVSPSSQAALQADAWDARRRSVTAWASSGRNAAREGRR